MRKVWRIVLLMNLLLVGCGKPRNHWPAHLTDLRGFSEEETQLVLESLERMNEQSPSPLLITEGKAAENAYPIAIRRHEPWEDDPMTAGITYKEDSNCLVELSTELFKSNRRSYLDSVVWHELGHCAGLGHNPSSGALMNATAVAFPKFTASALESFFTDLKSALTQNSLWSEPLGQ